MSSEVFPTLPGLGWGVRRAPRWSSNRAMTASGRRFAVTYWTYPIWRYRLKFEFLRQRPGFTEMASLAGFFNKAYGPFDTWLFSDPDDNAVSALQFGTGDGTTRQFALARTLGGFLEPVGAKNGAITVTVDGSDTTAYALIEDRIVNFDTAPAAGKVLRWTGGYYMRCAFTEDEMDLSKFMRDLWSADGVEFETVKP